MSQITSPIILDSTGQRIAAAIEALSSGGGGGGGGDAGGVYLRQFKMKIIEPNNDSEILNLQSVMIVSAIAPVDHDSAIGKANQYSCIIPVGLGISISDTAKEISLTTAQQFNLIQNSGAGTLHIEYILDSNDDNVGYGLSNLVLYIGNNKYVFDTGEECFLLDGTFNTPVGEAYAHFELETVGGDTRLYDV